MKKKKERKNRKWLRERLVFRVKSILGKATQTIGSWASQSSRTSPQNSHQRIPRISQALIYVVKNLTVQNVRRKEFGEMAYEGQHMATCRDGSAESVDIAFLKMGPGTLLDP